MRMCGKKKKGVRYCPHPNEYDGASYESLVTRPGCASPYTAFKKKYSLLPANNEYDAASYESLVTRPVCACPIVPYGAIYIRYTLL